MSGAEPHRPWDWFPGGYPRDRAAAIAVAIELGQHDDGQGDEAELAAAPSSLVGWTMSAGMQASLVRHGFRFGAIVQPAGSEWIVLGLGTSEAPDAGHGEQRLGEVLADHVHQALGVYRDLGHALQVAERWVLHAPVPSERCECCDVHAPEAP